MDHEQVLISALEDPNNTVVILPPANVNRIIRTHYKADPNFTYTKTQLWDMEVNKARNPEKYLGDLVRPGSLEVLDVKKGGRFESFIRVTDQRVWKDGSVFTKVIEKVLVDNETQRAFFIGVSEVETSDGRKIMAGREQALFHVEHSTSGTEREPLNVWNIVLLDKDEDGTLRQAFQPFLNSPYLRGFNEVYIREDLGQELVRA
ncbi:hypothetical protein PT974_12340 [Cladobotryum mycophilum]|uniref:Uncharacterized protein n=1 Tax=Cladobotryum mycophilum TaxID=491253 RepID=A0ABR0S8V5_9HYPO